MCHCERVAGVEVTLKAGPNYQKTFFRCYNPPTKAQCRFFAWTLEQPLRDYTYAAARLRVHSGTNQHYVLKRCRMCQKMMERYRRPPAQKTIHENRGPDHKEDYEALVEDHRQRY